MKTLELKKIDHDVRVGHECGDIEPNITEDTLFVENGEAVGFYIKKLPEKMILVSDIANTELLSPRVPKSTMSRSDGFFEKNQVEQFSTIIGGVPPKPHMRRPHPSVSSVHNVKSAQTFIKAMLKLCHQSEDLIKEICPEIYTRQKKLISEWCPEEYRLSDLFTSSISNFNIAARFHIDKGNIPGCVNVIIAKKENATGGNTSVPDYGATVDSCDNSILVYPAWRNVHGVTPIRPTRLGGYRNSLVFYPLKAFRPYFKTGRTTG